MKKVLAICLMMVVVVSMSLTVVAAPNNFMSSPSVDPVPSIISFKPSDEDCTAKLLITPYGGKEDLPDDLHTMMNDAYDEIVETKDLTKLNEEFAKLVADKKLSGDKLVVSDLFDIHVTGCLYHEGHVDFDITLDAETLHRFVGLLHRNMNGEWELVSNAKVVNNDEHLQFSVDAFSPFAIIVETETHAPQTSDSPMIYVYITLMAVSAIAIFVIILVSKRKKKD